MEFNEMNKQARADLYSLHQERERILAYLNDLNREISLKEGELRLLAKLAQDNPSVNVEVVEAQGK